jgi:hypothetical protein
MYECVKRSVNESMYFQDCIMMLIPPVYVSALWKFPGFRVHLGQSSQLIYEDKRVEWSRCEEPKRSIGRKSEKWSTHPLSQWVSLGYNTRFSSPRKETVKSKSLARWRWLTPVILATQEAEIRRILVWSQSQANSLQDPISKKKKKPSQKKLWWSGSRCRPWV